MIIRARIEKKGKFFDGKSTAVVRDQLVRALQEVTIFLEGEVKTRTPVGVYGDQGGLKASIFSEVLHKGSAVVKGLVGHQSVYGDVVEKGRRPGKAMPPKGALVRWMEVTFGIDSDTARQLEFVVRRKIAKKGFEGAHMFEKALAEEWSTVDNIFNNAGFKIAKELTQ